MNRIGGSGGEGSGDVPGPRADDQRSADLRPTSGAEQVEWDTAPLGVTLWGVYGPNCFPTVFACKLRNYPDAERAVWGFSIYRRQPGFRTLGFGKDWAVKHDLRLFLTRAAALAHISKLFAKAEGF